MLLTYYSYTYMQIHAKLQNLFAIAYNTSVIIITYISSKLLYMNHYFRYCIDSIEQDK